MAHHAFISYSDKDKSIADALCSKLEAGGVRCWISSRDVLPESKMNGGQACDIAIPGSHSDLDRHYGSGNDFRTESQPDPDLLGQTRTRVRLCNCSFSFSP
jgi:hypothetical protein